ncbi:DNA helicase II/ATP-dependent DNA helicase PcrA [Bathymodiolus platifrons methanotrophic gill symbiont]|uniref:DNA helicase II n=1 Tax=Bathymodiolus platifrons methanotrophic gill symbiont TaxID=113268 RepID=UPI000B415CAC|nr:DNA helicase II [Bathymodiolus platifrons methanotrophic gill symbiont]TXL15616.1 DNA helicase II [Methylococcaceae bacterium HT4]TXL21036.1 DNA helicase II [Methylococcaceae bacterium HT5]GAW84804.1 DNA helicase II/ATP-dependent DNA helicase PcrA [Bathymodiolus platifrons methanotrophic gill symbiont]
MDVTAIINSLNDAQREAVSAPARSMLVLAGAGSGKTRVLVHRIAWLIKIEQISPHNILAVTFTNKAAKEMRGRVEDLLNISARSMWIGTFHGLAHRLLRQHNKEAKLPDTFQVIDSDDQLRLIKRLMKAMSIDDTRWPPKQVVWFINAQKDEGIRAGHIQESGDLYQQKMLEIYRAYEDLCARSGLVDFAELLLRAHETLRDNAELLEFYRSRFKHVHVDEFQDTNTVQYAWLRLLTEGQDNLFVVGDDDQSIYGWRGAKIENMFNFQKHYPNHLLIRLEQNYRSTGNILKASNALIACNEGRMGKELRTDSGDGDLISLYTAFNEQDEAYFVVERIRKWVAEGNLRSDVAILYRSNAQSRQFEEKLMATGTPYRVYGGLRFFDRMEIKNALAYLFLMMHKGNDSAFERIINTPTRGVGAKTLDDIRQLARERQISLWQAMLELMKAGHFTPRAENALKGFIQLINSLGEQASELELYEQVKNAIEKSGLIEFHKKEKGEKGEVRVENLEELVNAARQFDYDEDNEENFSELDLFLAHAALESGDAQADDFEDCVQLMTLHSAKGLEFPIVFMVGLEEGLFPSQQSVDDIGRLEEERRLCYVGMTRAMKLLYISYAESRRLYGKENYPRPSRFLKEIPAEQLQEIRVRANVSKPVSSPKAPKRTIVGTSGRYKLGQHVRHEKFGEGVVLQVDGDGAQERVQINFATAGMKWLMLSYAKLEIL